jgi:meiotically up-regulated gene 157 (Mug157) protein
MVVIGRSFLSKEAEKQKRKKKNKSFPERAYEITEGCSPVRLAHLLLKERVGCLVSRKVTQAPRSRYWVVKV